MGLIARNRSLRYAWFWRVRYWWMDTHAGQRAQGTTVVVAALLAIVQLLRMSTEAPVALSAQEPAKAWWWIVQLVIAIVAAIVAYAMRPKPQQQPERVEDVPTVKDGAAVKDYGGTVWIAWKEDFKLAHKIVGRDPIYTEGGKK